MGDGPFEWVFECLANVQSLQVTCNPYSIVVFACCNMTQPSIIVALCIPHRSEKCSLHQLGRTTSVLLAYMGLTSNLYSLTRVLRIRRKKKSYERGINSFIGGTLQVRMFEDPPAVLTTSTEWRNELLELLLQEAAGKPVDRTSDEAVAVTAYFDFFNGDVTGGIPYHWCNGCHTDEASAMKDGKQKTKRALHGRTRRLFEDSRWMKQQATATEMGREVLIHNLAKGGMNLISFLISFKEEND